MDSSEASAKGHRKRQAGPKAERKKKQSKQKDDGSANKQSQRNAKAYTFKSAVRASRQARRTLDVDSKRMHVPIVDRTPQEPPPVLIAVVGPAKVGKSTLIDSLIKNFTRQNMGDALGPITVVSGRKRRLTFVECNNDISSMIDIAKVADLVLLLIDASFGFEMEVFEFLNICQVHGFPRIMGVLTHLDVFKQAKTVRKTKKQLKHRFWTEIYQGAKLFYLSGLAHGRYPKMEVHNLGRFISVMKFRPLQWRGTHPYILGDRMEDLTDPELIRENKKCNRTVSLYGYVRGTHMKDGSSIHLAGVGDFILSSVSELPDPCPLPDAVKRRRSLNDREQKIYAPMAGVGGVVYDKDAVYVDLRSKVNADGEVDERTQMADEIVSSLDAAGNLDAKTAQRGMRLYQDDDGQQAGSIGMPKSVQVVDKDGRIRRRAIFDDDEEESDDADSDEEEGNDSDGDMEEMGAGVLDKWSETGEDDNEDEEESDEDSDEDEDEDEDDDEDDDDDEGDGSMDVDEEMDAQEESEDDDDEDEDEESGEGNSGGIASGIGSARWKENLAAKAAAAYRARSQAAQNLQKLVYGRSGGADDGFAQADEEGKEEDVVGGLFKVRRSVGASSQSDMSATIADRPLNDLVCAPDRMHARDCSWHPPPAMKWDDEFAVKLKNLFVTGDAADADLRAQLNDDDEDLFGDFEDMETGEVHRAGENDHSDMSDDDEEDDDEEEDEDGDLSSAKASGKGSSRTASKPKESQEESRRRLKEEKRRKLEENQRKDLDERDAGGTSHYEDLKQEASEQAEKNRKLFDGIDDDTRNQLEGFRPGAYVRLEVRAMPCEFVDHFDPSYPIIIGGILSGEQNIGYIRGRIKKHRWHKRILKTRDPLIISLGWRRYQTVAVYSSEDHNMRQRFIKYTPEHMHCTATMYGPVTPPGTGFLAIQTLDSDTRAFRIAAIGVILELDKSVDVVKKLKLVGTPMKVFKKTAYIKGMFSSQLEVSKFEGVAIRTVSGIRGEIKKAIKAPNGAFRATFEDKLLKSDIVFVRAWVPVKVPTYFNIVTSLLQENKSSWSGMRTVGQMRFERGLTIKQKKDSIYKPIERERRRFNPFVVPKSLNKQLPFKSREKDWVGKSEREVLQSHHSTRTPEEKKIAEMVQKLFVLHKEDKRKKHLKAKDNLAKYHKAQDQQRDKAADALRRNRKDFYQKLGKASGGKGGRQRGGKRDEDDV